jgi:hypothetical protein
MATYTEGLVHSGESFFFLPGGSNIITIWTEDDLNTSPPAFLPANSNHRRVASFIKDNTCASVADLLGTCGINFDAVDCLRRPRACLLLREETHTHVNDHCVVITVREMPGSSPLAKYGLLKVMQDIHKCTGSTYNTQYILVRD